MASASPTSPASTSTLLLDNRDHTIQIATLASKVLATFDRLSAWHHEASLREGDVRNSTATLVEDALQRFRLWAGNLGALFLAADVRSLEHRVRNAPMLRRRFCDLLEEMLESLIVLQDSQGNTTTDHSIGTLSDSPLVDTNDDGLLEELTNFATSVECQQSNTCASIEDTLTRLFRLSSRLSKTSGGDRFTKADAARHDKFDDSYDIAHAKEKFACQHLESWLITRLGRANTKRRQFFRYCRNHHEKLSSTSLISQAYEPEPRHDAAHGFTTRSVLHARTVMTKPSIAQTAASTLYLGAPDAVDDGFDDSRSVSTLATALRGPSETVLYQIPLLTDFTAPGKAFECPYCCRIVSFNGQRGWKKHVFADLKPYVCTSDSCGLMLSGERQAWIDHEMEQHRREWTCRLCESKTFNDRTPLWQHLESIHQRQAACMDLDKLIDTYSRPAEVIAATDCPLCDYSSSFRQNITQVAEGPHLPIFVKSSMFMKHLAHHMEQLALFALPRRANEDFPSNAHERLSKNSVNSSQNLVSFHKARELRTEHADDSQSSVSSFRSSLLSRFHPINPEVPSFSPEPLEAASPDTNNSRGSTAQDVAENADEDIPISCVCGYFENDGWLVACDSCHKWQHQLCYYPSYEGKSLPEDLEHYCIDCLPRADINIVGARDRQSKRREEARDLLRTQTIAKQKVSSYWSVVEQKDFVKYVGHLGRDFAAIASYMGTKTETMVKNHYQRQIENDHGLVLERSAEIADDRVARGEDIGPPPWLLKKPSSNPAYIRPQHSKVQCNLCNEYPDGFRGEHELRRHHERKHSTSRRVWICIDPNNDTKEGWRPARSLGICKQCYQHKEYNISYNAAAHLRRAHFCPRKQGRKATGEERENRASKAGGDWPPIDWLKDNGWVREVEVSTANHSEPDHPDTELLDPASEVFYPGSDIGDFALEYLPDRATDQNFDQHATPLARTSSRIIGSPNETFRPSAWQYEIDSTTGLHNIAYQDPVSSVASTGALIDLNAEKGGRFAAPVIINYARGSRIMRSYGSSSRVSTGLREGQTST